MTPSFRFKKNIRVVAMFYEKESIEKDQADHDAYYTTEHMDQVWEEHVRSIREDVFLYQEACEACNGMACKYMCAGAKAKFIVDWEKSMVEDAQVLAHRRKVLAADKCAFCDRPPQHWTDIGIVCWECYAEKKMKMN